MEFSDRLNEVMQERGITSYKLALLLGISKTTLANYLTGKTKQPHSKILDRICEKLSINRAWLENGNGPKGMLAESDPDYHRVLIESAEQDIIFMSHLKTRLKQLREEIKKLKRENSRLKHKYE